MIRIIFGRLIIAIGALILIIITVLAFMPKNASLGSVLLIPFDIIVFFVLLLLGLNVIRQNLRYIIDCFFLLLALIVYGFIALAPHLKETPLIGIVICGVVFSMFVLNSMALYEGIKEKKSKKEIKQTKE